MKKLLLSMTLLMTVSTTVLADAVIAGGISSSVGTTFSLVVATEIIDDIGRIEAQQIANDIAIYDVSGEVTNSLGEILEEIESTDTDSSIKYLSEEVNALLSE